MRNRKLKDYTGQRFGRLTVVRLLERESGQNNHLMEVRCDCGVVAEKRIKLMRSGKTTSCGCAFREVMVARNSVHGMSRTHRAEYRSWKDMRARCNNLNDNDYADYGGRGIRVCERWNEFAAFFEDMGHRPIGHTLDRIDVNGNYEPGNCRWASAKVQANNKRSNNLIEIDGVTKTLQSWCEEFATEPSKVRYRLSAGYAPIEALTLGDMRIDRREAPD